MSRRVYRDAGSGEFVTAEYAAANPTTTIREVLPAMLDGAAINQVAALLRELVPGVPDQAAYITARGALGIAEWWAEPADVEPDSSDDDHERWCEA